jgi:hypothetical protein
VWTVDGPQVYDTRTPLDVLCDQEDEVEPDRRDVFCQAMGALFIDGPHPANVMRHAYRMAQAVDARLLRGMPAALVRAMIGTDDWARMERIAELLVGTRVSGRMPAMHDREIQLTMRAAHARLRAGPEGSGSSLEEMLALQPEEKVTEYRSRMQGIAGFLRFFFLTGPAPAKVVRRIYCVAKGVTPHHVLNMTLEQLGAIFGEVRATWSWRVKRVMNRFLKLCGARAIKLSFQKSDEACAKYAAAQLGNRNRRGGGLALSA